jgi:hypothetical protein
LWGDDNRGGRLDAEHAYMNTHTYAHTPDTDIMDVGEYGVLYNRFSTLFLHERQLAAYYRVATARYCKGTR